MKKLLSFILAVLMIALCLPVAAIEETENDGGAVNSTPLFISVGLAPDTELESKNGMCYIFRLADGSFVIYDGGWDTAANQMADKIMSVLRANAPDPANIVISAWVLTHAHTDHVGGFNAFTEKYRNAVTVKNILADIPDDSLQGELAASKIPALEENIALYTSANKPALSDGYVLDLANNTAKLEVIYTHTAATLEEFNASSVVTRITVGGQKFLMTGDMTMDVAQTLTAKTEKIACDVVQVPHHGYGSDTDEKDNAAYTAFFTATGADLAIWPASLAGYDEMKNKDRNNYFEAMGDKLIVALDNIVICDNLSADATSFDIAYSSATADYITKFLTGEAEDGTEFYPYLVATADEFLDMYKKNVSAERVYFRQICDIDFNNEKITPMSTFMGVYDGAGYKIKNYKITEETSGGYAALFSQIDGAVIKNVHIVGATINIETASNGMNAAIVGKAYDDSLISSCTVDSTTAVNGTAYVGGIIGWLEGSTVEYCINNGTIKSLKSNTNVSAGGIVGWVATKAANIRYCVNNGVVYSECGTKTDAIIYGAGGILGAANSVGVTINNCVNNATISCDGKTSNQRVAVGGIIGRIRQISSTIEYCYNTVEGVVSASGNGTKNAYLIIGAANGKSGTNVIATIKACYAVKSISTANLLSTSAITQNAVISATEGSTALDSATIDFNNSVGAINAKISRVQSNGAKLFKLAGVQNTVAEGGRFDVRFLSGLNSLNFEKVGYDVAIAIEGETTRYAYNRMTEDVYNSVMAGDDTVAEAADYGYSYFACYKLTNLPADKTVTFTVSTYVINSVGIKQIVDTYTVVYTNGTFTSITEVVA